MKTEATATAVTEAKTEKRRDLYSIRPENILIEEGFNARIDMGDIISLAESIKESGLKTPLRVYRSTEDTSKVFVVNGHRRKAAIDLLLSQGVEIEFVDVFVEPRKYSNEERTLDLILTNDGKPLTKFEESIVVSRLTNYGWDIKQIAKRSGRSVTHVNDLLSLSLVPQKIKNLIIAEKITEGAVIQILKATEVEAEQVALAQEAVDNVLKANVEAGVDQQKKATVKNIKSSEKLMSPIQILKGVVKKLEETKSKNRDAKIFLDVMKRAIAKESIDAILKDLF